MRLKKVQPTPDELSLPEYAAMRFIQTYRSEHRKSPTVRQIQEAIGLSLGATHDLLSRLVAYGYLERRTYRSGRRMRRNLRVLREVC